MRILVTGGAGYIGSVVAAQLVAAGHEVVVYDNLSKGSRDAVPRRATLIVGDVGDRACLDAALRQGNIDSVMHFAAWIEAGESMKKPSVSFATIQPTRSCSWRRFSRHHVPRFVFSSTAALYGNPAHSRRSVRAIHCSRPTPTGNRSCSLAPVLIGSIAFHGLSYANLRYFNAAGATPNLPKTQSRNAPDPAGAEGGAGRRGRIAIFGTNYGTPDGTCVRDYIHVCDLARPTCWRWSG